MEFIFATNNKHKLFEIQRLFSLRNLSETVKISSLETLGFKEEIPETGNTLEHNALQKAEYIHQRFNKDCFADDTGLIIDSLGGEPGVYSARYAGPDCSFKDNVDKVLFELNGISKRTARFQTVIAAIINGKSYTFNGEIQGVILEKEHGEKGFGYDPIFLPDGYDQSFAEMPIDLKNKISHRALAFINFLDFLENKLNS